MKYNKERKYAKIAGHRETVRVKPLSVNQAWKGKRLKTPEYKAYEKEVMLLLPKVEIPEGSLKMWLTAGLSSKQADIDNVAKPFIDILQKKYGFNDNQIYMLFMFKQIVKKGDEYMSFHIESLYE